MYPVAGFPEVSLNVSIIKGFAKPGRYKFTYDNYTSLWNVLDYCATTIPVTYVSPVEDTKPQYEGRSEVEAKIWQDCTS